MRLERSAHRRAGRRPGHRGRVVAVGDRLTWSVANRGDAPVAVDAVAMVGAARSVVEPLRVLRHGYQSWSPTAVATFGVDHDPTRVEGVRSLAIGMHHADWAPAEDGELRSELVTALRDAHRRAARRRLPRRLGARRHLPRAPRPRRLGRRSSCGSRRSSAAPCSRPASGASCTPCRWPTATATRRRSSRRGPRSSAPRRARGRRRRTRWAGAPGTTTSTTSPRPTCASNLTLAADWPFEVFQLDDGFQAAIGDWLDTNDKFPRARRPGGADRRRGPHARASGSRRSSPAPDSPVAPRHPDWLGPAPAAAARRSSAWSTTGGAGRVHTLDTTRPDVLDHLEVVARHARRRPASRTSSSTSPTRRRSQGGYADPSRTPAQRVRAGLDAIRRGAGDDAFLLGCGARSARPSASSTACASVPTSRRGGTRRPTSTDRRATRRRAGDGERVAQHAEPLVPAPAAVAQRPRLPDAADRAHEARARAGARVGARRRRERRHGARLRRPRAARAGRARRSSTRSIALGREADGGAAPASAAPTCSIARPARRRLATAADVRAGRATRRVGAAGRVQGRLA